MKRKMLKILPLLILFSACAKKENVKTIAIVDGEKITEKYFENKLFEISPNYQKFLNTPMGKKQFLDILINEKLISIDAKKSPLAKSKEYKDEIEKMRESLEKKLDEFKNYLLTKKWIEELKTKNMAVSEKEIKDYFGKYPVEVKISQIILPTYAEAETIYKKVKRSSKLFAKTAKKKSLFGGLSSGNNLPPIMRGEFIPELEDMAFKMKIGETQGIVKTKYGYHILHKISSKRLPFNKKTQERVRRILEKKKFDDYLEKLRSKYKVEVIDADYK